MSAVILIPYGGSDPHRERGLRIVEGYFADHFPEWPRWTADMPGTFSRAEALNTAARRFASDRDVLIFNDADSLVPPSSIRAAFLWAKENNGGVRAYSQYRRLSEGYTKRCKSWRDVLGPDAEVDWEQERTASHGVYAITRRRFLEVGGYDPRFIYFYDDLSFDLRAEHIPQSRIVGPLVHMWHPPREAPESDEALWYRYEHEVPEDVRAEAPFP